MEVGRGGERGERGEALLHWAMHVGERRGEGGMHAEALPNRLGVCKNW